MSSENTLNGQDKLNIVSSKRKFSAAIVLSVIICIVYAAMVYECILTLAVNGENTLLLSLFAPIVLVCLFINPVNKLNKAIPFAICSASFLLVMASFFIFQPSAFESVSTKSCAVAFAVCFIWILPAIANSFIGPGQAELYHRFIIVFVCTVVSATAAYAVPFIVNSGTFGANSLIEPFSKALDEYYSVLINSPQPPDFNIDELKNTVFFMLPDTLFTMTAMFSFIALLINKFMQKNNGITSELPLSEFRIDKLGAVLFILTSTILFFMETDAALFYIFQMINSFLSIPLSVEGLTVINFFLKKRNAGAFTKVLVFAGIFILIFPLMLLPMIGVLDAFYNFRNPKTKITSQ